VESISFLNPVFYALVLICLVPPLSQIPLAMLFEPLRCLIAYKFKKIPKPSFVPFNHKGNFLPVKKESTY